MSEQRSASVPDPLAGGHLMQILLDLVDLGPRRAGTSTERQAAEYILRRFREIGLQHAHLEEFSIRRWEAQSWELTAETVSGQHFPIPCQPAWYSPITSPEGVRAGLCYAGDGTPADFTRCPVDGGIAVIESKVILNFQPAYKLFQADQVAAQHGAQALIVLLDAADNLTPAFTEREEQGLLPIPVMLVGRDDALLLRHLLLQGDELQAFLKLEAYLEEHATTQDVVGILPGSGDDFLIVGSHYDSTHSGAVDNAGSNAGLLALAEHFARQPFDQRSKTMIFAAHPGHEISVGARHFVATRQEILPRVAAYVSLDGFGSTGWLFEHDGGAAETGTDEKRGITISGNPLIFRIVAGAVRRYHLLPAAYVPAEVTIFNPDLEGRFYAAGVPVLMIIGKPVWYHTPHDTPDKCTPDQLERSARAHAEILEALLEISTQRLREADRSLSLADPGPLITPLPDVEHPALLFNVVPKPVPAGVPAIFHIVDFRDPAHLVVHLEWDFGDGERALGPLVPHAYSVPGRYTVTVEATNDAGRTSTASRAVWVV